jgi:hypothetical protein
MTLYQIALGQTNRAMDFLNATKTGINAVNSNEESYQSDTHVCSITKETCSHK